MTPFGKLLFSIACCASIGAQAETIVRVGITALPPSYGNPFRTSLTPTVFATAAVFDALTRFNGDYELEPWLATGWEPVDARTWRFTLRKGVTFSNGKLFTAAAVVHAARFLNDPGSPQVETRVLTEMPFMKAARAVDAHTVEITTTEPLPSLPRYMAAILLPEPEHFQALGVEAFARDPVGTGPYQVEKMDANLWSLRAVPAAWRPGRVDRLEIVAVPIATSRAQAIQSGRIDVALGIGPDEVIDIEGTGGIGARWPFPSTYGISFSLRREGPTRDVRVRRALNMAVNKQRIIDQLLAGTTVPTGQPAPKVVLGHDPAIVPYPFDPAMAKKLLAEAGYSDGFELSMEAMTGAAPADAAIFQQVSADLAAVGVVVKIRTMPTLQFLLRNSGGDIDSDLFPTPWLASPSADIMRSLHQNSCYRPKPYFCDPALTPKMTAALHETDPARGLTMRRDLAKTYHDQAPAIFLFETVMFAGLSARVDNFHMDGLFLAYHDLGVKP
jgi:peptide/nickel transport system substrate-binding protein